MHEVYVAMDFISKTIVNGSEADGPNENLLSFGQQYDIIGANATVCHANQINKDGINVMMLALLP